jgi:nucleoid DNA-binding protein
VIGALEAMAAKGIRERVLNPALRKQGLSVRKARAAINIVFDSIQDALACHARVELPIGTFTVLPNSKERGWRFGKVIDIPKYRVKFLPSHELKLAAAAAPPSPHYPKRKKREKKPVKSELAISTELIVDFIRKNVPPGNWRFFFNQLSAGARLSIHAMFARVKPRPDERRPLSEAAQVIEECAPSEMPEDPRRHLDACLEWFARWTQRVMPNAIWQQAMQQAMKTLLGPT